VGYDDGGMLTIDGQPSNKEHFGFSDGFSNPDVAGSGWPSIPGGGKPDGKGGWSPLAPGEVVLGQRDEAGEMPVAPKPVGLARNGTFMVYRKLEEKVYTFRSWLNAEAEKFPGGKELLAAKLVGRWRDGAPLVTYPQADGHPQMTDKTLGHFTDYSYASDPEGARCPMGAHTRRVNPRDSLGFDGTLVNRHRVVRRGLNYGEWVPEGQENPEHDTGKGVLFMVIGASIERQFEFVQTEWVNYGNDFLQGNDPDPMIGDHGTGSRLVVQGDAPLAPGNGNGAHAANGQESVHGGKRRTPWICANLPQFVATRGGDYFFMPSLTALRLIAAGRVKRS
jgi:Dyp-type peroxidase family